MKLFGRGKAKSQEAPREATPRCSHPVAYQVMLREDAADPHRITAVKCTQCGERIPYVQAA